LNETFWYNLLCPKFRQWAISSLRTRRIGFGNGSKFVKTFGGDLLYARVDGILKDGNFLLMELELIEPDLYFDYAPDAKKRYIEAIELVVGGL
jgi:hypothetical protein